MALVLGFVMAWIITRTNVPGRRFFEQVMVVPYYLTPLLGALAWSLLGTPESGFLNQVYPRARRQGIPHQHQLALRHRLGDGAVRGLGRLRDDRRRDEVDGPGAGGSQPGDGREPAAHHAAHHAAAGAARRARRRGVRVRRDARLVRGRARARPARPLLRGDYRDLSAGAAISAEDSARGRDGHVAVRRDVRDAVHLSPHHHGGQLRDHHRQGVPPARQRCRAAALRAAGDLRVLSVLQRGAAAAHFVLCVDPEDLDRVSRREQLHHRAFLQGVHDERRDHGARQQRCGSRSGPRRSACC